MVSWVTGGHPLAVSIFQEITKDFIGAGQVLKAFGVVARLSCLQVSEKIGMGFFCFAAEGGFGPFRLKVKKELATGAQVRTEQGSTGFKE